MLKVARAAKKAASTSSIHSNDRSRSERFEQRVLFTPPKGMVDYVIRGDSPVIHINPLPQQSKFPPVVLTAVDAVAMQSNNEFNGQAIPQPNILTMVGLPTVDAVATPIPGDSGGNLERDLSAIMDVSINAQGTSPARHSLLPNPPKGEEPVGKPIVHVSPLGFSEDMLKEFERNSELREMRLKEEALEFQQQVLREAENQVLRL